MLIDLHVHTDRYSKCAHMTPDEMAETALSEGLDGVVITEHNTIWSEEELNELRHKYPALVIMRGFEVSAQDKFDVLVYGVYDTSRFYIGMPVRETADIAHSLGGFVILAHAFRYRDVLRPEVLATPFDACETHSINIDPMQTEQYLGLIQELRVPSVHNSDGHVTISLGGYYNEFHIPVRNEAELLAALRAQAYTPKVRPERVEPALGVRLGRVEDRIRRIISQGITDPDQIYAKVGGSRDRIRALLETVSA